MHTCSRFDGSAAARRQRGERKIYTTIRVVFFCSSTTAPLLLQGKIVGEQIIRNLSQLARSQKTTHIVSPKVFQNGSQFFIRCSTFRTGFTDIISVIVCNEIPAM